MEDYLLYMKTLRSQMNDVEDQAAKISVEEQMQLTTIQTLEKDLELARADIKRLKAETDQMVTAKGQTCSQILEKQRKIASLESDSITLSQTLELIQQERVSLSAKIVEKRAYYANIAEATNGELQKQQKWIISYMHRSTARQDGVVKDKSGEKTGEPEGRFEATSVKMEQRVDDAVKNLVSKLDSLKAQLEILSRKKFNLASENNEVKQSMDQVRSKIGDFKPELQAMNIQMLEEEHHALLSDRDGESQYMHSLQQQFETLKGISHVVKCGCGEEYKVEVNLAKQGIE